MEFLIRKYRNHLTIYTKQKTEYDTVYSGFQLFTDTSVEYELHKAGKSEVYAEHYEEYGDDFFYCRPFYDFNLLINKIVEMMRDDNFWLLWNDSALPRPKRVELKGYFNGSRSIDSIDSTIFAAEELSCLHGELFAENEMLEKIKTLKVGQMLSAYKITEIKTEVKNDYYHAVGLSWVNTNFEDSKEKWQDVYTLSRYYFEYIFS